MSNLTAAQVDADVNYLINSLEVNKRLIPSASFLLKKSSFIPLLAIVLSFLSDVVFYVSSEWSEVTVSGFFHFFMTEGWVVTVPTAIVGVFFVLFTYSKLMMYMTVPESVRNKSLILNHLRKVTSRVVKFFMFLMACSVILSALSPWFTFAIPGLLFALIFAVGFTIGAEINRFGTGLALEKISSLIQKF